MGWQVPERFRDTYRLVFADPEFHGLQVYVRRASYETIRRAADLGGIDLEKAAQGQFGAADLAKIDALVEHLGAALVSWNLQDAAGEPVPATLEALRGQDLVLVLEIIDAWLSGVAQTQVPVRPEPVDEMDLPMETLN